MDPNHFGSKVVVAVDAYRMVFTYPVVQMEKRIHTDVVQVFFSKEPIRVKAIVVKVPLRWCSSVVLSVHAKFQTLEWELLTH
jgi:hypothetical protein